jgi:hypothetical protein
MWCVGRVEEREEQGKNGVWVEWRKRGDRVKVVCVLCDGKIGTGYK